MMVKPKESLNLLVCCLWIQMSRLVLNILLELVNYLEKAWNKIISQFSFSVLLSHLQVVPQAKILFILNVWDNVHVLKLEAVASTVQYVYQMGTPCSNKWHQAFWAHHGFISAYCSVYFVLFLTSFPPMCQCANW